MTCNNDENQGGENNDESFYQMQTGFSWAESVANDKGIMVVQSRHIFNLNIELQNLSMCRT